MPSDLSLIQRCGDWIKIVRSYQFPQEDPRLLEIIFNALGIFPAFESLENGCLQTGRAVQLRGQQLGDRMCLGLHAGDGEH